jgi:hypothetical protein
VADQLYEITRSLGRIESKLEAHDQALDELKTAIVPLTALAYDFHAHVEADKAVALQVLELVNRPAKRRKAVVKWIGGVATIVIAALVLLLFGVKP